MNSALGELTGVGLELQAADDGLVTAVNVQDESPALEAGLLPGDVLLNVDGTKTAGLGPEEVAALLRCPFPTANSSYQPPDWCCTPVPCRGKEGTKASLQVARAGAVKEFEAIRRPLKICGVKWQRVSVKGRELGVVTVRQFSSSTADEVADAVVAIEK